MPKFSPSGGFMLSECHFAFGNISLGTNISGSLCMFLFVWLVCFCAVRTSTEWNYQKSAVLFYLSVCRLLPFSASKAEDCWRLTLFIRKWLVCCNLLLWEAVPTAAILLSYWKLQFSVKKIRQTSMIFGACSGSSAFSTVRHLNMSCWG